MRHSPVVLYCHSKRLTKPTFRGNVVPSTIKSHSQSRTIVREFTRSCFFYFRVTGARDGLTLSHQMPNKTSKHHPVSRPHGRSCAKQITFRAQVLPITATRYRNVDDLVEICNGAIFVGRAARAQLRKLIYSGDRLSHSR